MVAKGLERILGGRDMCVPQGLTLILLVANLANTK